MNVISAMMEIAANPVTQSAALQTSMRRGTENPLGKTDGVE
jgi:hypothetical protein